MSSGSTEVATPAAAAAAAVGFFGSCESVTQFQKVAKIGEGTYGTVYKAIDQRSGVIVALKQIKIDKDIEREGMPLTASREIQLLKAYHHPNIVELREVVVGYKLNSVFLVFEYCEHDMAVLVDNMKKKFSTSEVKCIITQVLKAVAYMHSYFILHRDLKLSNLLYNNRGEVKICDFGLARKFGLPAKNYTPKVLTLWYRSPEILLGESVYTTGVDMWAVGCIFGELIKMQPLLPAKTEAQQLGMIFDLLGTPNSRIWPGYETLPLVSKWSFPPIPYSSIRTKLPGLTEQGYHLFERLLAYDPKKRISAKEALSHPYFTEHPRTLDPALMPTFPSMHGKLSFTTVLPINNNSEKVKKEAHITQQQHSTSDQELLDHSSALGRKRFVGYSKTSALPSNTNSCTSAVAKEVPLPLPLPAFKKPKFA